MKFLEKFKEKKLILVLFILSSIIPFIITVGNIYTGRIAFWYDPARDFILALQNLRNPTLIGQPSGLPGLFYGPYWIWTISLLTLVSKDPRIISFLLLTVPYFTIFPYILYKLSKNWGVFIFISLWLLFILNFGSYASQIWNVHYGAIFFILAIYLFINSDKNTYVKKSLNVFFMGLSIGLVANFHLSLGIPSIIAFLFSLILVHILENRRSLVKSFRDLVNKTSLFLLGILISFAPFFIFEFRHGFIQIKTFIKAITNSVVYNTASVGQTGMTDQEIIKSFFNKFTDFLGVSSQYFNLILGFIFVSVLLFPLIKKTKLDLFEKRLLILLFVMSFILIVAFVFNKNPIWGYYFIGVELIFMLFIGLFLSKISLGKYIILIFLVITFFSHKDNFWKSFKENDHSNSDLGTRNYVVETVFRDADKDFQYYAYSSAIYTYEFDYLFMWNDEKSSINVVRDSDLVYLIIPNVKKEIREDFINYKTPMGKYNQIKKWNIPDGTSVYKMLKK